jgi:hypothetical protein
MFKLNTKTYPWLLFVGTFFVLVLLAFYTFSLINKYDSNRIPNLRKVPAKYRASLVDNYLGRVYENDSILVLGDSQANGALYPTEYIYSTLLQNSLETHIFNLAFQDSRILDNIYILKHALEKEMKFKAVIFSVNHAHVKESDFQRIELKNRKDHLAGLYRDLKSFVLLAFTPNPKIRPSEKLSLYLYPNYFDLNAVNVQLYTGKLNLFLDVAKRLTEKIIVFPTPHSQEAVVYSDKSDIEKLSKFNSILKGICLVKNVSYFEPNIFESKYFIDIVHFNTEGHKEMARLLQKELN